MSAQNNHTKHLDTLDRDLSRMTMFEQASTFVGRPLIGFGLACIFVAAVGLAVSLTTGTAPSFVTGFAAIFAAYMALNIGANDVANNMGPAVGSRAIPISWAIALAAICETAGALLAGETVTTTIARGLVDAQALPSAQAFIWMMMAALLSAAIWINLATWIGAPVSTTHAIVGGVVGGGLAAAGASAVAWPQLAFIAGSWIMSPLLGGVIAAACLALIRSRILVQADKIAAACVWLPVLVGIMSGAFTTYLCVRAFHRWFEIGPPAALAVGAGIGLAIWGIMRPLTRSRAAGLENRNKSLKTLFEIPLVIAAALLSFAHGANDVANAIGPLAAIVQASRTGDFTHAADVPTWVMMIGTIGISVGLILFGPRLIRVVGTRITRLNPIRAFCVILSAAITVSVASTLGLPVSSTHIAIGAVFGVGFFREWQARRQIRRLRLAPVAHSMPPEERRHRKLVRRSHVLTILAAWVVTVPATAILSAALYLIVRKTGL